MEPISPPPPKFDANTGKPISAPERQYRHKKSYNQTPVRDEIQKEFIKRDREYILRERGVEKEVPGFKKYRSYTDPLELKEVEERKATKKPLLEKREGYVGYKTKEWHQNMRQAKINRKLRKAGLQ